MARVTTSRVMFQSLAKERLSDAKLLYSGGNYSGAYYLAGYVVECALKAAICRKIIRHTLPEKKILNDVYQHDLDKLMVMSGLTPEFNSQKLASPGLEFNWNIIKDWRETTRYQRIKKAMARDLINAVGDGEDSFLGWVQHVW